METISSLQQQFPLSPRKFWKKFIQKIFGFIFLSLVFSGVITLFRFSLDITSSNGAGKIALFMGFGTVIFFLLFAVPYAIYLRIYIRRYYYSVDEHFLTIKKGVFAPTEIHVQYQKIQDVYVDQDVLDRIMGLYDVHIASATVSSGMEAHIDGVDKVGAEGIRDILLKQITTLQQQGSPLSSNPQSPGQQTNSIAPIRFVSTEEISSNTYPLSTKWLTLNLISRILGALIFPALLVFFLFVELEDFSILDYSGYIFLAWIGLSIFMIFLRIITLFIWRKNYAFRFDTENIYYRTGVISLSEKHMPYSSIQDVSVNQSVMERIFRLAKVKIENASPQMNFNKNAQIPFTTGMYLVGITPADANKIATALKTGALGRNTTHFGL